MKKVFLIFSLFCFTSCTTLTGAERCALIGQTHEGTQIATQTHVSSVGGSVYSYNTPSYQPICKNPKTTEEKEIVADLIPIAKQKQSKKNTELMIAYASIIGGLILVLFLTTQDRSYERYSSSML